MTSERWLIVNADDLGLCEGVNAGILEAHERGIVTSASLMVRQSAAEDAVRRLRRRPRLAVGLHLDLDGWDYARSERRAGESLDLDDATAVEAECRRQLESFRKLVGRDPTHLDSHHHVHLREPVAAAAMGIAAELAIPLRGRSPIRYEAGFFGRDADGRPRPERISAERLVELIASLHRGWTELGCHPGRRAGGLSSYGSEREREVETLCDERVLAAIEQNRIQLRSFAAMDATASTRIGVAALRVEGVEKSFRRGIWPLRRRVEVLRGASLEVRAGELVGLVGENGSGKSTMMQIIVGLLGRDGGEVERPESIGYCPQLPMLWEKLTVEEHFELYGRAYGMDDDQREAAVAGLLEELQFAKYRAYRIEELSGGTRQKLNLAISLMHEPALLLLDEPYSGFDWETYLRFWEMSERRRDAGMGILIVSHLLAERERLDRMYELREGRIATC